MPPRPDVWPSSDIDIPLDPSFGDPHIDDNQNHFNPEEECIEWDDLTLMDLEELLDNAEKDLDDDDRLAGLGEGDHSLAAVKNGQACKWPTRRISTGSLQIGHSQLDAIRGRGCDKQ